MTKQAELKKQAYGSNLKSRALSVLIYLIDRSNKDLTCFPAIPTMAEQLHISVSTVKRALKELTDTGYIQKEARFRERNHGQSSNLYTLLFKEQEQSMLDNDNTPVHEECTAPVILKAEISENKSSVDHITFDTLKSEEREKQTSRVSDELVPNALLIQKKITISYHSKVFVASSYYHFLEYIREAAGQFGSCFAPFFHWTGGEVILYPP